MWLEREISNLGGMCAATLSIVIVYLLISGFDVVGA